MEDGPTHGGFHEESPVRPDDAPTPTADVAGRAEDPALLTSLSAKLDRCMGRLDSLETELGKSKKIMGEGDVDVQDDIDLDGLSRIGILQLLRTEFSTPAFEQFQVTLSAGVLPHTAVPAGPSIAADKGKAPMSDLDIPAEEYLANVSEERAKELDDLMMRMTETDWLNLMMQVGSNPALAKELLGADVNEGNFIERMTAVKERKKRALADLRYRALKGKPLKKSEVTQMMRNLVKNQWCAAHNGTITMKDVKAMNQKQLVEEYEYICRRLEKDRLLSAQYNLFRPKPAITEPPSKRQRVDRATPMAGSAASNPAGGTFDATDSAASSSPSNVSIDHIPIDVLFESTSGGILEFFLDSDEEEKIGMSRVVADPDSDDEVFAEIIFRGKSISGDGVVFVDKLPDDEIVDPRVKVETITESAASPPRFESESDDDMENYIPPLPYGAFKDWEIMSCPLSNNYYHVYYQENRRQKSFTYLKQLLPHVYREDLLLLRRRMNRYFRLNPEVDVGLELWRDVNMLCQSLHSDDVEDFWRTQDEWIVSSWQLLTVPPSYCRDVVVAGNIIQTVQAGLRQAYECLASAPIPEQTATGKDMSNPLYGCDGLPKTVRVFQFTLDSCSVKLEWFLVLHQGDWKLLFFDVATSFDSAVHRVHAVSFDAAVFNVADTVSAAAGSPCICWYLFLLLLNPLASRRSI
ncbi:hypothetical protein Tco_1548478 [Tanacetum coccineum]